MPRTTSSVRKFFALALLYALLVACGAQPPANAPAATSVAGTTSAPTASASNASAASATGAPVASSAPTTGASAAGTTTTTTASREETLLFDADLSDQISFDPAVVYEFGGIQVVGNLYETLVSFDPG